LVHWKAFSGTGILQTLFTLPLRVHVENWRKAEGSLLFPILSSIVQLRFRLRARRQQPTPSSACRPLRFIVGSRPRHSCHDGLRQSAGEDQTEGVVGVPDGQPEVLGKLEPGLL
jgi:hypothetical protein